MAQFGETLTVRKGIFRALLDFNFLSGSWLLGWLSAKQKSLFLVILLKGKDALAAPYPPLMQAMGGGERVLKTNAAKLRICNDLIQS